MALVLARRAGDWLVLNTPEGQRVVVKVVSVDRFGEVKLAVEAPRDVVIARGELDTVQR